MRYGARRDERRMSAIFRRSGPRICTNTREHLRMLAHATRTRDQWPADHLSRNTRVLASRGNIDTNPPDASFRYICERSCKFVSCSRQIGLSGTVYLFLFHVLSLWKQYLICFRRTVVKICILLYRRHVKVDSVIGFIVIGQAISIWFTSVSYLYLFVNGHRYHLQLLL